MSKTVNYEHYIKDVEPVDFLSFTKRHLVESIEELDYLLNNKYKDKLFMAFDIETTGLNPIEEFLVGYSFAFDGIEGYYVPVNHKEGPNLGEESIKMIYDRMTKLKKTFCYNLMFDFNFLEFEGQLRSKYTYDMDKCSYYDVMVGVFLSDTNIPFPSLKKSAKKFLGWNMDKFEATLGDNYNFHYVNPKDAYDYGALDSISTFALAPISLKFYQEAKLSGKIDNDFILPFTRVLRQGIRHDIDYLNEILEEQESKLKELESEIYRIAGKEFKINSPKGLSDVLMSLGIHTGETTKSGYMKTDLEHLANANIKHPHPMLDVLSEYKRLSKVLSTYVRTLHDYAKDTPENRLRYCYHLFRAPTCRLAAGKDGKNNYFTKVNIQAVSKPHSKNWYVHDYKPGDVFQEGDRVVLDWRFSLVEESEYMIEALDPHWNIRDVYLPEKNHYWVSMDYSAEELRLIANYSKEPLWVSTFLNGGDLHRATASKIFHKEVEDVTGDERKKAKSCFSMDSYIYTNEGAIKASNLTNQYILNHSNENQDSYSIVEKRKGYKFTMYSGREIKVTQDHEFVSFYNLTKEYKKACDFKVGDQLPYKGIEVFGNKEFKYILGEGFKSQSYHGELILNKDIAYLVGLYLGDGHLVLKKNGDTSKHCSLEIVCNKDNTEYVESILKKFGNPRRDSRTNDKYDIIRFTSSSFCSWLQDFAGRTKSKYINDVFYQCSREVMLSLLAGLIDSDGKVRKDLYSFTNTSKSLVKDVIRLVSFLGIRNSVTTRDYKINGIAKTCYNVRLFNPSKDIPNKIKRIKDCLLSYKDLDTQRGWILNKELLPKRGTRNYRVDNSKTLSQYICKKLNLYKEINEYIPDTILSIEEVEIDAFIVNTEDHEIIGEGIPSHNCNFGLAYGMSPYTMVGRFKLPLKECEELHKGWWSAVPHIKAFQQRSIKLAKSTGTIYNYFGRPRRVKSYFRGDRKQQSFGERTVRNTMIQSMGADIFKVAFLNLYKKLYTNPKYKDHCRFLSTVH